MVRSLRYASLLALGLLVFDFSPFSALPAASQVLSQPPITDEEVLLRMIGKRDPQTAEKIKKKFKKIDESNLPPADKDREKVKYLLERLDKLNELRADPLTSDEGREIIGITRSLIQVWITNPLHSGDPRIEPSRVGPYLEEGSEIKREFYATYDEIVEERRKEAELDKGDGVAPEHSRADGAPRFEVAMSGGFGLHDAGKQDYLATETGPGLLFPGRIKVDREAEFGEFNISAAYVYAEAAGFKVEPETPRTEIFISPFFRYAEGSSNQSFADFDTGAAGFVIPGLGDPASLFPDGHFIGPQTVTGLRSTYDFLQYEAGVRAGINTPLGPAGDDPFLSFFSGFSYQRTEEDSFFGGSVPGNGVDFAYDTRVTLDTFKISPGVRVTMPFDNGVSVFIEPSASIHFIDIGGSDRLTISGGFNEVQRAILNGSETGFGARLAGGVSFSPPDSPFQITLGGFIETAPDTVVIDRPATPGSESEADVLNSTGYGGNLSMLVRLN